MAMGIPMCEGAALSVHWSGTPLWGPHEVPPRALARMCLDSPGATAFLPHLPRFPFGCTTSSLAPSLLCPLPVVSVMLRALCGKREELRALRY